MFLYELLRGLKYELYKTDADCEITEPFSDSRRTVPGGLFVCLQGTNTDGRLYIENAVENGAAAVVSDRAESGVATVVVHDTRFALAVIWNNFYKRPAEGMRLFGITGTNGKTSTAAFLVSCLKAGGRRVGTVGTLGCFACGERIMCEGSEKKDTGAAMTTPDPGELYRILSVFRDRGITDVVMEVSSHAIVQRKVDALSFHVGIFTNLSPEHLDYHNNMEEYFRAKASFISRCAYRIVNEDDADCRRFLNKVPSVAVGRKNMSDAAVGTDGVRYTLSFDDKKLYLASKVGGVFTLYNTMLASVAALLAGVKEKAVEKGIADVERVDGRLERVVCAEEHGFDLIIDYAHTPAALEAVLLHLRKTGKGKLICVFGCGGDRDKSKRPEMGLIAERLSDGVVVTCDNPRTENPMDIIRDIIKGMTGENSVVIPDRREAIITAISMTQKGDTVLLAGKGHERYEIRGENKSFFDEREVVKEALRLKTATD